MDGPSPWLGTIRRVNGEPGGGDGPQAVIRVVGVTPGSVVVMVIVDLASWGGLSYTYTVLMPSWPGAGGSTVV